MTIENEVDALLQSVSERWNAGDADAYAEAFTEDASYVAFDGSRSVGRKQISEMHRGLFRSVLKGSRLVTLEREIRPIAPEAVEIFSKGAVLRRGQSKPSKRALSVQTWVAVKRGSGWRISAFQNTRYRPFTQTLLGRLVLSFTRG